MLAIKPSFNRTKTEIENEFKVVYEDNLFYFSFHVNLFKIKFHNSLIFYGLDVYVRLIIVCQSTKVEMAFLICLSDSLFSIPFNQTINQIKKEEIYKQISHEDLGDMFYYLLTMTDFYGSLDCSQNLNLTNYGRLHGYFGQTITKNSRFVMNDMLNAKVLQRCAVLETLEQLNVCDDINDIILNYF